MKGSSGHRFAQDVGGTEDRQHAEWGGEDVGTPAASGEPQKLWDCCRYGRGSEVGIVLGAWTGDIAQRVLLLDPGQKGLERCLMQFLQPPRRQENLQSYVWNTD